MSPPIRLLAFAEDSGADVSLEEALLLLSSCRPGAEVDVGTTLEFLDRVAPRAGDDVAGLCRLVFGELGFGGDTVDYHDPRNSLFDEVVRRRLGMPITLAVVLLAIARRQGIALQPIGTPGHFLVFDPVAGAYHDPFDRGQILPKTLIRLRIGQLHPSRGPDDDLFAPVSDRQIVARVLNNLQHSLEQRDPRRLDWFLDVRLALPADLRGHPRDLAALCERRGRFADGAAVLEAFAATEGGRHVSATARRMRARLN